MISNFALAGAVLIVGFQIYTTKQQADATRELEESPITFSDLTPDRPEYHPGDLIKFAYTREVKPKKVPFSLVMAESFSNIDTGEEFLGARSTKTLKTGGTEQVFVSRRIPLDCTPGRYIIEGLANAQSTRLSRIVGYSSTEFLIKPK